jgi:type IV pilus assembly protein PilM
MSFSKKVSFAPPKYLSLPTAGIDVTASGIKVVMLIERAHGLELDFFKEVRFAVGIAPATETSRMTEVAHLLSEVVAEYGIQRANIELSETRGYLFEAIVEGNTPEEWRASLDQHIDEYVPLPPAEVVFDSVPLTSVVKKNSTHTSVVGIGCARRVIEDEVTLFESAGIEVRALESETFALPRAILPHGDKETVLIIDIGKSSTKLLVVSNRLPRFATTLEVGGHALTLAVQKYFGVTEEDAKRIKTDHGMVPVADNADFVAAMHATISVLRTEILRRIDYWDSRKSQVAGYERISRAILVGGNATLRGLPEYLESALKIPVELGDVFTNFASRADWLPPLDYTESLAFGTAIGLALREYVP